MDWKEFLMSLKQDSGKIVADEANKFFNDMKNTQDEWIKKQGELIEKYLIQLAKGEINKDQFIGYVNDIKTITEMKILQMSIEQKASVQRLIDGVKNLFLGKIKDILL